MLRFGIGIVVILGAALLTQVGTDPSPPAPANFSSLPLQQLSSDQLDRHLRYLAATEPDPATRLVRLAHQAIGTPYQAGVLGEGMYDSFDTRPMASLEAVDSASFVSQTLAMAVSPDYSTFFLVLQRLRYADGQVSTATRNHNLVADWARGNGWLLEDITPQLGGAMAWIPLHEIVRRSEYLSSQYGIQSIVPDEKFIDAFIPRVYLLKVLDELRPGDVAMAIIGDDRQQHCVEMGIIASDPSNVDQPLRLIHADAAAGVKEDAFRGWTWNRKDVLGFKFLRLRPEAPALAANEAAVMAGRVAVP